MSAVQGGVSVIVPVYNRAALLPATLDAILGQTAPPQEVIVVDDGSTDETPGVLRRYGARIRVLTVRNGGDLAARNAGLAIATGRLVAFCDSDDLWQPTYLATMQRMWEEEPGLRFAFGDFVVVRDGVWESEHKFAAAPPGFWDGLRSIGPRMAVFDMPVQQRLLDFQPFFPSCLVADRDFLAAQGGWDESVGRRVGSDFATALRLTEFAPFGVMHQALVGIRKHAGNFSADVQAMNLGDAWILDHVLATRPAARAHAAAFRRSAASRRMQALDTAFARGDYNAVQDIALLLAPQDQSSRLRMKARIAGWPALPRQAAGAALLSVGSIMAATRRLRG